MSDENNFTPPPTPTDPPKSDSPAPPPATPAESEISAEKPVESETVRVKVEPVEPTPAPVEPEIEKPEPPAFAGAGSPISDSPTPPTAAPAAEPEVENSAPPESAEVKVEPEIAPVAPTPPTPTPVEPEIEKVEPVAEPEMVAEPAIAQSEIIAGAPSRPGDKIEKDALSESDSNSKNPKTGEKKLKTGFRPDGVTPLDGEEKMFSAVGYISFICFLPLLTRRDSEFAQHHARQATVIFIGFVFLWMVATLSSSLRILVLLLNLIAIIGGFALAYKGDWFKIPGIYDLSLKLKQSTPPSTNSSSQTPPEQNSAPSNLATNENEIGEDGE